MKKFNSDFTSEGKFLVKNQETKFVPSNQLLNSTAQNSRGTLRHMNST